MGCGGRACLRYDPANIMAAKGHSITAPAYARASRSAKAACVPMDPSSESSSRNATSPNAAIAATAPSAAIAPRKRIPSSRVTMPPSCRRNANSDAIATMAGTEADASTHAAGASATFAAIIGTHALPETRRHANALATQGRLPRSGGLPHLASFVSISIIPCSNCL